VTTALSALSRCISHFLLGDDIGTKAVCCRSTVVFLVPILNAVLSSQKDAVFSITPVLAITAKV